MRTRTWTIGLTVALLAPALAHAQGERPDLERKGIVRPVGDRSAGIDDAELDRLATAIRRGEPAERIATNWRLMIEGAEVTPGEIRRAQLVVLHRAYEPVARDLESLEGVESLSEACAEALEATALERSSLRSSPPDEGVEEADVERAVAATGAVRDALATCRETIEESGEADPAGEPAFRPRFEEGEEPPEVGKDEDETDEGEVAAREPGDHADKQLRMHDLQDLIQRQQEFMNLLSEIARKNHETTKEIIRNLR